MNDSFKTLLAFLGGAAAGLAVGMLIAPEKGSDTRKRLLARAKDLTDDLSDVAREKYEEVLSWKDDLLDEAEDGVRTGVSRAESSVRKSVNHAAEKAEGKIRNAHI